MPRVSRTSQLPRKETLMGKQTAIDRAIQNLDEKIAALQLAKQHLVEQQQKPVVAKRPRKLAKVEDRSA